MTSQAHSIRSLIAQVSGLIGLLVFLNQAWGFAPLERTILTAFGAGLATYVVLVLGYATVQRILAYTPSDEEAASPAKRGNAASAEKASAKAASGQAASSTKAKQAPDGAASDSSTASSASNAGADEAAKPAATPA